MRATAGRARWLGAWAVVGLVALLARGEASQVIGDLPVQGITYPGSSLYSAFSAGHAGSALRAWAGAACSGEPVRAWLWWQLAFDVALIAAMTGVGFGAGIRWRGLRTRWLVGLLAVAATGGDVLAVFAVSRLPGPGACLPGNYHLPALWWAFTSVAVLRLVLVAVIVLRAAWVVVTEGDRRQLRRFLTAIGMQRFIIIVAGVLGVLLVVPGVPILEQGVDVERSWFLGPGLAAGLTAAAWALASMLALAAGLRYLASVRAAPFDLPARAAVPGGAPGGGAPGSPAGAPARAAPAGRGPAPRVVVLLVLLAAVRRYRNRGRAAPARVSPPARRPRLRAWLRDAGSVLLERESRQWVLASAVVVLIIFAVGRTAAVQVYVPSLVAIGGVLLAVPLLSALMVEVGDHHPVDVRSAEVREVAWQLGRALALLVPAILGISVCRSLVVPMLPLVAPPSPQQYARLSGFQRQALNITTRHLADQRARCTGFFFALAAVTVIWVFVVLRTRKSGAFETRPAGRWWDLLHPQLVGTRGPGGSGGPGARIPNLVQSLIPSLLVTAACVVPLLVFPIHASRLTGVIGTVGLGLLLLTAFYAVLQILAQLTDPPRICRVLKTERAPIVTLVVLIGVLSTILGAGASGHDIRRPAAGTAVSRPSLAAAWARWRGNLLGPGGSAADQCAVPIPGAPGRRRVQPLLLVAAEGGGIRAAWWTVDVMSSLASTPCGRRSVFLASGVSGGAVGLAVMDTSADPYSSMNVLAGPDGAAVALDGLLSRDLLAGSLGISVRAADGPAGVRFPDRAALLEQTWDRQVPGLAEPFPQPQADRQVPWYTVFNGTSVAGHCRVLISDIALTTATQCDSPANPVPGAYDLDSAEPCDRGIAASTASLLAARFAYVTPSARITSCGDHPAFRDQVIDGGYSENHGIDTLDDALLQLLPRIQAANKAALKRPDQPLIAPLVIFLHNTVVDSGTAPATSPAATPEILVPLRGSSHGILGASSTLLQRASDLSSQWLPAIAGLPRPLARQARADHQQLTSILGPQAVTVAPQRQPAINLPLGWALSRASRETLNNAFSAYLSCVPAAVSCAQSQVLDTLLRDWGTKMEFPPRPH